MKHNSKLDINKAKVNPGLNSDKRKHHAGADITCTRKSTAATGLANVHCLVIHYDHHHQLLVSNCKLGAKSTTVIFLLLKVLDYCVISLPALC